MLKPPSGRLKRLCCSREGWGIVRALITAGAGGAAAWRFFRDEDPVSGWIAVGVTIGILGPSVVELVIAFRKEEQKASVEPLEAALEALHGVLVADAGQDHGLRICLHVPDGEELVQVTEYVGTNCAGSRGRRFAIRSGIIGRAIRMHELQVAKRGNDNYEAFLRELIERWGYTRVDAEKLSRDRYSWAAMPIGAPGNPIAVLFCDSKQKDFFGRKDGTRQKAIMYSCVGIAKFLQRRGTA